MLSITQLPFPKKIGVKHKVEYVLPKELFVPTEGMNGIKVPAGTKVKLYTTYNFGWLVLPEAIQGRRIFQW